MKFNILFTIAFSFLSLSLQAQQRMVLFEQFTNAGCPPCAENTPFVTQFARDNQNFIAIVSYHTSFPYNDSLHFESKASVDARVAYYGVTGVPYSIMDGNFYRAGSDVFRNQMATKANDRKAVAATYSIKIENLKIENGRLKGNITATSLGDNQNDSLKLFIAAVERDVPKSAYQAPPGANNEQVYRYSMRQMFPSANGTALVNKNTNGSDAVELDIPLNNFKSLNELNLVAFVQNTNSKEVYQALMTDSKGNTVSTGNTEYHTFYLAYDVANRTALVSFREIISSGHIILTDIQGREIENYSIENTNNFKLNLQGLNKGIYLINISGDGLKATEKLVVY